MDYHRKILLFEKKYTRRIYNILRRVYLNAADKLKQVGVEEANKYANSLIMIDGIGETVLDIYKSVGVWVGKRTLKQINLSAKEKKAGFGINERWIAFILEYFRLYLLNKAVLPISKSTRDSIVDILDRGVKEGWGIDKMVYELELVDMPLWRARMIVRTEVLKASNYGTELGKRESGFETVEIWISGNDARTRRSHRMMDNKIKKEGEKFKVPIIKNKVIIGYDLMNGPGDPTASAGNIINCRCTRAVKAKRDKNGRLVRKQKNKLEIALSL